MTESFVLNPKRRRRARAAALAFAVTALLVVLAALEAQEAAKRAWTGSWRVQAEELGAFARSALGTGNELLLVERLRAMTRRDEVAYVVLIDAQGQARYAGSAANAGKRFTGPRSRAALAAKTTVVVEIAGTGVTEVVVPVNAMALRCGFKMSMSAAAAEWLWGGVALAVLGLSVAGLLALRLN